MKKRLYTAVVAFGLGTFVAAPLIQAETVTLDASLGGPGFYNGSGSPDQNFTIATAGNLQLGLEANLRFIGPIDPGNSSNYIVPTGNVGCCAGWDVLLSGNTQAGGGTATLGNYSYTMQFLDVTTSNAGPIFDPSTAITDDSYQGSSGETVGIATKNGTDFGFQNAENLSFAGFLPGFDSDAQDTYEVILDAYNPGPNVFTQGTLADQDTITISAQAPEPGTWVLFAGGLGLLGMKFLRRRRVEV